MTLSGVKVLFVLALSASFSLSVQAGDVEDGRAAIVAGDYAKAIRLLAPLAKQGEPVAQNAFGALYLNGWGVNQHYGEALK